MAPDALNLTQDINAQCFADRAHCNVWSAVDERNKDGGAAGTDEAEPKDGAPAVEASIKAKGTPMIEVVDKDGNSIEWECDSAIRLW